MGMSSGSDDDFVSEINVTPFVDVMLVLLIIFMVTAPMMVEGLDVKLPPVQAAELLPAEDDHLILTIKDNGSLFLDEMPVVLEALAPVLKAQVLDARKRLFLRADRNVPYGVVADVMSRARAAGINDLGMVTTAEATLDSGGEAAPEAGQAALPTSQPGGGTESARP